LVKKLVVANWKENKTVAEALEWLKVFLRESAEGQDFSHVVLCPSAPLLYPLRQAIRERQVSLGLGAQDVSRYEEGAYTGEVSVRQLRGLADYVLVGHSERARYFGETLEAVAAKVDLCQRYGLLPLIFLRDEKAWRALQPQIAAPSRIVVVYEPPTAISRPGVYRPETPAAVAQMVSSFKAASKRPVSVLYGGSVNEKNIEDFLTVGIEGVVVGQASLDPHLFAQLTKKVLQYDAH
jgi:triosephosphate isomerase